MRITLRLAGVICLCIACVFLGAWLHAQKGAGKLTWQKPEVKKSVHTFAYKVYADPHLSDGRFFLSKIVFKNEGSKPVTDFSVSYQIPNYVSQTTPETLPEIPPGFTVVKLFYPQFASDVTKMRERTKATLEVKLQWKEDGKPHEDVLRDDFTFRGVNELEYTDIPAEERIIYQDVFLNADLLAAMVTPNDPVVGAYASEITARLEGAVAGAGGGKEAHEFLKGTYDYMVETGLQYAGDKGVPEKIGDVATIVQTIRLPRDQIRNNNGLCIELALLWASLMEHMGIRSCVVLRPGHAFIRAADYNFNGKPFTVECTAITPKAVDSNKYVSFEQAVKMSQEDYARQEEQGTLIEVDIQKLQGSGIVPPELPDVDIEKLKAILASRRRVARVQEMPAVQTASYRPPPPANNPAPPQPTPPNPAPPAPAPTPQTTTSLTAFSLIHEGNRYVGEQCKDAIVQIRSERSIGNLTPNIWYLVYYDPDATFKATEVKFIGGQKVAVSRPPRVFESITGSSKTLDRSKFKLDSDRALGIATTQPMLKDLSLKASQFWLQHDGPMPVWRVRLWAAKLRNPNDIADIGDVYISTDDGSVLRSDLHINNVD